MQWKGNQFIAMNAYVFELSSHAFLEIGFQIWLILEPV